MRLLNHRRALTSWCSNQNWHPPSSLPKLHPSHPANHQSLLELRALSPRNRLPSSQRNLPSSQRNLSRRLGNPQRPGLSPSRRWPHPHPNPRHPHGRRSSTPGSRGWPSTAWTLLKARWHSRWKGLYHRRCPCSPQWSLSLLLSL